MTKKLETVREASASTGIPQSRLYELVAKAKANPDDPRHIPYVQIESRIYFRTGALDEWIERLEVAA
ncbi:MAG: helix-turn-helix domain-containing protein [Actinobacteria bacterium]|nr:helix-turn-helix domain-containing protein [Actinomycetota bacterium]